MGRLFTQISSDWKFSENKICVCSTLILNWFGMQGSAEITYWKFIRNIFTKYSREHFQFTINQFYSKNQQLPGNFYSEVTDNATQMSYSYFTIRLIKLLSLIIFWFILFHFYTFCLANFFTELSGYNSRKYDWI